MPIEFEAPKPIVQTQFVLKTVAEEMMRSHSRYFDEHEHEVPWDYIEFMHSAMRAMGGSGLAPHDNGKKSEEKEKRPSIGYQMIAAQIEALCWGDVGMYHCCQAAGWAPRQSLLRGRQNKRRNSWRASTVKNQRSPR
jgi:acyl-CoA dehydrogenase